MEIANLGRAAHEMSAPAPHLDEHVCTVEGRQFLPATDGVVPSARLVEIAGGLPSTR